MLAWFVLQSAPTSRSVRAGAEPRRQAAGLSGNRGAGGHHILGKGTIGKSRTGRTAGAPGPGERGLRLKGVTRRKFVKSVVVATAATSGAPTVAQSSNRVSGFDHVALPMQNTDAMLAFYRRLGFDVRENAAACSVYVGTQMINFHRPARWQDATFTLRAPKAQPPCGDLCFVWSGTPTELKAWLDGAGAGIVEGPVPRQGGRKAGASSVYIRDPDGNLLEFMIYS